MSKESKVFWVHLVALLAISTLTFCVFFGTFHKSIAITQPFSIYIGLARSAMATVARTIRQPKSKRPFFLI